MVYERGMMQRPPSLQDYDRLNEEFQLKKQKLQAEIEEQKSGGSLPAAMKIANRMFELEQLGNDPNATQEQRVLAEREYNLLGQAAKTYGFDRGVQATLGGQMQGGLQRAPMPELPDTQEYQDLPPVFGDLPQDGAFNSPLQGQETGSKRTAISAPQSAGFGSPSVSSVSGYDELMSRREAMKSGASEKAKLQQQLQYDPLIKRAGARAAEEGKAEGVISTELQERVSVMPQLIDTTQRLSALGKLATYTMGGQARDFLMRQAGMDVPDAAVARSEYISMVDNEVLPLLRQTFGAQFTQKEGESLKATLGDPNKSPQEKDAVLRSFLNTKMKTINSQARRIGEPEQYTNDEIQAVIKSVGSQPKQQSGVTSQSIKEGTTATNPTTGQRIIYTGGQWRPL
jgi:hypothetical protein